MNPNHLTPEVRSQVIKAEKSYRELQEEKRNVGVSNLWDTEQEAKDWIQEFHQPVSGTLNMNEFSELLLLETKHGFVSGYIGGAILNPDGDTKINIG